MSKGKCFQQMELEQLSICTEKKSTSTKMKNPVFPFCCREKTHLVISCVFLLLLTKHFTLTLDLWSPSVWGVFPPQQVSL